jgi:DNA-binding CsgD family transcriptional regulator
VELPQIHLTAREKEIAQMCAQGLLSKEIAAQLGVSPRTVETHKNNLFKKLGINNTVELMRYMQMTSTSSKR